MDYLIKERMIKIIIKINNQFQNHRKYKKMRSIVLIIKNKIFLM